MSFLSPLSLLFLLGIPPLVMLYFLKLKRPQVAVPSNLLWRKVVEDLRVNSPFQKLRRSLLLLLQLLLLLALAFALARPLMKTATGGNGALIVLIDASASMNTIGEDGKSRFELATEQLHELIDNLATSEQMMVIGFTNRGHLLSSFTSNKRQLHQAVDKLQPTQRTTDVREALVLAKSLAKSGQDTRLAIISDGAFNDPGNLELPFPIDFQMVGTPARNVAITGLDIRRSLKDPQMVEMFVSIQNFSEEAEKGNMMVYLDDELLDSKFFQLDQSKSLSQIFEATLPDGGDVRVSLDVEDALKEDNEAWQVVQPPQPRTVMIVGARNFFLERVFEAAGTVHVDSRPTEDYVAADAAECTVVIWNRVTEPKIAPTANVYLGCFPALDGLELGEVVNGPDVMDWDNGHALNRFIDYSNLLIEEGQVVKLPPDSVQLVRSSEMPLMALAYQEQTPLIMVCFDPFASNWPLLVSFPIFLHNCINFFEERGSRAENTNLQVGRVITCPERWKDPILIMPDATRIPMNKPATGDYAFSAVDQCGTYKIEVEGEIMRSLAVNLFDRRESMLTPEENPQVTGSEVVATNLSELSDKEYAPYLLAVALLLLMVEWVIYHRRVFV